MKLLGSVLLVVIAYPTIPDSSSFAFIVILFVVAVVSVTTGFVLSIFVTLNAPVPPMFVPSVYRYVIVQLLLTVNSPVYCVLVLLHLLYILL